MKGCTYVCVYICVFLHTWVHVYTYIHRYIPTYTCKNMCVYIYIYSTYWEHGHLSASLRGVCQTFARQTMRQDRCQFGRFSQRTDPYHQALTSMPEDHIETKNCRSQYLRSSVHVCSVFRPGKDEQRLARYS